MAKWHGKSHEDAFLEARVDQVSDLLEAMAKANKQYEEGEKLDEFATDLQNLLDDIQDLMAELDEAEEE